MAFGTGSSQAKARDHGDLAVFALQGRVHTANRAALLGFATCFAAQRRCDKAS